MEDEEPLVEREPAGRDPIIRLEIYGIVVLVFAVALLLSLLSFDAADIGAGANAKVGRIANWLGPIGAHVAEMFLSAVGIGAFAVAVTFGWLGTSYLIGRRARMQKLDVAGALLGLLALAVMAHVIVSPARLLEHPPGGWVGSWVGEIASSLLSTAGTFLLFGAIGIVSVMLLSRRSIFELAGGVKRAAKRTGGLIGRAIRHGESGEPDPAPEPVPVPVSEPVPVPVSEPVPVPVSEPVPVPVPEKAEAPAPTPASYRSDPEGSPRVPAADQGRPSEPAAARGTDLPANEPAQEPTPGPEEDDEDDVKIVESAAMRRTRELSPEAIEASQAAQLSLPPEELEELPYVLPTLSMLDYRPPESTTYEREALKRNAQILESKLLDYKVKGRVVEIHPGPVVTMYEFMPAAGIKVSAIAGLANDLAMALSAISIRIVAPIPGKNVVGIEIPNATRETVWLKEILSDTSYARAKSRLTLALGKDIVGNPTCMNLAKAPHLLVAGATGAGKSVAINSFVMSLLYKAEPSDVRLIMVDPKMLELSMYEGIPHLLLPVVTDPKQAATALKWAVKEMERRYRLMADMGVRHLAGYNQKAQQLIDNPGQRLPERLRLAKIKREAKGEVDKPDTVLDADGKPIECLPSIVVIIDELADLMMVASKEVEHCIARLAQMARASGIHMIVATQRPSVDVITGLIKANFPTRMSFRVASGVDSRTILDQKGAEALLGMGDMLYMPPGQSLQRVHGCFVSEEEVHRVVAHLKEQGSPEYDMGILAAEDDDDKGKASSAGDSGDELYDQAVRIAAEARYVSTSYLQRKLKIGYNRSARIIEQMEENGIIGPSDGTSRPREVFIDPL